MPKPEAMYVDEHIIVYNIVDDLPHHKTKHFDHVEGREINRVILHHSAGGISPGIIGPMSMGRFFIAPKIWRYTVEGGKATAEEYTAAKKAGRDARKRNIGGRNWPGFAYHVFIPYAPELDSEGRMIIYQTQEFDVRGTHTGGGQNAKGIGVVCQGLFVSKYVKKQPKRQPTPDPSEAQKVAAESVWKWLSEAFALTAKPALSVHAWHGKPACPGQYLVNWVTEKRAASVTST